LARDSAKRIITLDLLYEQLKLPEGNGTKLSITDESEKKLQRIIDFINENFTSDISREGLAAAIGMNPNYMSSLFKEFTGMKINDYINKLRIDDAVIKLKTENIRIIDIALSVGFESLSTFNRAFKNIMNTTPSQYREQN
ncbi:MAG: helix-turn-helix transcriptional regulator, partial [archaeon]|nr:helix-turn-helix transcriptional regulator [archaeon]